VGFQYRRRKRTEELYGKDEPWRGTAFEIRKTAGGFEARVEDLAPRDEYEFRAVVKHPLLTVYGEERPVNK
jgi:alpha-L-fucosidase